MHNRAAILLLGVAAALVARAAPSQDATPPADLAALAERFVERLVEEDYATAVNDFDKTMATVMPPDKLKEAWTSVLERAGPFKRQVSVEVAKVPKYRIGVATCEFEKGMLDVKVVFDADGKVSGLWFAPTSSAAKYQPPSYAKPDSFEEQEVSIGSFFWSLPGTLAIPQGDGPFPAVVLVHGSGPHDRDETIGPHKPFRDLACGLASRGIAVLRYEKRTKKHALKLSLIKDTITVKEETIDDALAAVTLLRETERIATNRIFVLGHSLGGMLAPRIGARGPEIAGLIMWAATTRPLEDVILDQRRWLFELDGELSVEEKLVLAKIEQQVARVKDPQLSRNTAAADLPLSVHAAYWLDLRDYDPAEMARSLKQPMLILQGQRDYQVTMEDFDGWKRALSSREDVQFKLYPKCNHLFVEGEGQSTPAEYQEPGNVAETVIDDIAKWISQH
jgi:dienelactone hydrolase